MSEPAVRFRTLILAGVLACGAAFAGGPAPGPAADVLRVEARVADLPNGLRVVAVPFREPDTVVFSTIVRAGARNEVEPGQTGLARFFERLVLGIGPRASSPGAAGEALFRLGAEIRGFSTEDYACRSIIFAGRENLDAVMRAEAARIMGPRGIEAGIRTLAPALEREARAVARKPEVRLIAALRNAAYENHPYRGFPWGALRNVPDAPAPAEAAGTFGSRFYAPEHTILLAVGDIVPDRFIEMVRKQYGGWVRSGFDFQPAAVPPQKEPKRSNLEAPGTSARLGIAFLGPAFSDSAAAPAALDLIAAALFSSASPLYQKLVIREKRCASLEADFHATRDPSLLVVTAGIKDAADLPAVEAEILGELERVKRDGLTPRPLAEAKARVRFALAGKIATAEGASRALASIIGLTGDPASLNRIAALTDRLLPSDILQAARAYFKPSNSTTVTLGPEGAGAGE